MKHLTNFSYTEHLMKNKLAIIYIKILRYNRGGEYNFFLNYEYCQKDGIKREFTTAYTPQQNGDFERKNKTSIEAILIILTFAKIPKFFWGKALMIANYL